MAYNSPAFDEKIAEEIAGTSYYSRRPACFCPGWKVFILLELILVYSRCSVCLELSPSGDHVLYEDAIKGYCLLTGSVPDMMHNGVKSCRNGHV